MLGDLATEIESSTAPPARAPPGPTHVLGRLPFPKIRDSVAKLLRAAGTRVHEIAASAKNVSRPPPARGVRRTVFLIQQDRVLRASLGRSLLNARFDVDAFDSVEDVVPALRQQNGAVILIINLADPSTKNALPVLAAVAHEVRVIATWKDDRDVGIGLLKSAGIRRFIIVSAAATPAELAEAAQELART
jgi:hypothetical protein